MYVLDWSLPLFEHFVLKGATIFPEIRVVGRAVFAFSIVGLYHGGPSQSENMNK